MTVLECSHCIMRSVDDPALELVGGVCNHCRRYEELLPSRVFTGADGEAKLSAIVKEIKEAGAKKRYDCLIGLSGGVDSTSVAVKVKELGLRPLAFHVDNGWNTELAVSNVEKTVKALDLDLVTEVLDLRQFYDLQRAFLLASTPDADVPADHAIQACMWKFARKYGGKYIISGMNFRTEAISVPSWSYGHSDWRYIKAVHDKFGREKLTTYPHFGFTELGYTNTVARVRIVSILNYFEYNKAAAVKQMQEQLDWRPYPGKHFESIFTRFFQGYILPVKFNIDKRRGHLSDLINSGQITREQALEEIEHNDYTEDLIRRDREFFCKKLNFTDREFDDLMAAPVKSFRDYKNSYGFVQFLRNGVNVLRKRGWYPK